MSKQIVGDVAVGRHVYIGGNANVSGNATIKQNLKVDGWLDAKNIKHTNKGLFPSSNALNEAYPEPELGWYALVGERIPAKIYIVEDGEWKDSNKESNDLEVTLTDYVTKGELQTELTEVTETSNNAISIANEASTQVSAMGDQISNNQSAIATLQSSTEQTGNKVLQLESTLSEHSLNIEIHGSLINENDEAIAKHRSDVVNDVARLDAKNAEQDSEINEIKQSVQGVSNSNRDLGNEFHSFKDEVETKQYQVDNKITNVETLNAKQTLWHEAHSIINLHRFVNFAVTESATFVDWMTQVPSQLIRNGLIVMINTAKGWEAWQLVNADEYLAVTGYKKIDWDNSLVLTEINALKARIDNEVANLELEDSMINNKIEEANVAIVAEIDLRKAKDAEQDTRISQLEENGEQQKIFNVGVETHIMQTENDYIGVEDADGNGTLFPRVIALEGRVDSVDLFIREIELRLDALNSRISALENKL